MVESRQPEVLAIVGVFAVVSFVFVITRVWSRYLGRNFSWDDYLIVGAMVILVGNTIGTWKYILLSGTGFHVYDLPKRTINEQLVALRWNFAVQMMYHPLMGLIRASIIMFLFRMKDNRRRIRYSLHAVFWLNVGYAVGTFLVNILQCQPARYVWSKPAMDHVDANGDTVEGGKCIDARTFILTSCALSIFMDLIIIPIPSIMVWNLQMCRRTKVLVVFVMSLVWIATGVSVGRFVVYYYRFAPTMKDRTWNIGIAISIAEPAVHIMTACAPATKCLFRYLFPYWGSQRPSDYYDERSTANRTDWSNKSGRGRTSRGLSNFRFSLDEGPAEPVLMTPGHTAQSSQADFKDGRTYDGKRMDGLEDRNLDDGVGIARTSCSNTAYTKSSEPTEAEPKHCLGLAR